MLLRVLILTKLVSSLYAANCDTYTWSADASNEFWIALRDTLQIPENLTSPQSEVSSAQSVEGVLRMHRLAEDGDVDARFFIAFLHLWGYIEGGRDVGLQILGEHAGFSRKIMTEKSLRFQYGTDFHNLNWTVEIDSTKPLPRETKPVPNLTHIPSLLSLGGRLGHGLDLAGGSIMPHWSALVLAKVSTQVAEEIEAGRELYPQEKISDAEPPPTDQIEAYLESVGEEGAYVRARLGLQFLKSNLPSHESSERACGIFFENINRFEKNIGAEFSLEKFWRLSEMEDEEIFGYALSLCLAGDCYARGTGTQKNLKAAEETYRKGLRLKNVDASVRLANISANWTEKFEILNVAADYGDATAQFLLGKIYYAGDSVERNVSKALAYFLPASENDHIVASHFAGEIISKFRNAGVEEAAKYFGKSAAYARTSNMCLPLKLYRNGYKSAARILFEIQAELGYLAAAENAREIYLEGVRPPAGLVSDFKHTLLAGCASGYFACAENFRYISLLRRIAAATPISERGKINLDLVSLNLYGKILRRYPPALRPNISGGVSLLKENINLDSEREQSIFTLGFLHFIGSEEENSTRWRDGGDIKKARWCFWQIHKNEFKWGGQHWIAFFFDSVILRFLEAYELTPLWDLLSTFMRWALSL